jgi:lactoylglutathione lyase
MMRIEHVALWTEDLERLASFYSSYFGAKVGDRYTNATKGFESRFLSFDSGARLEIMRTTSMSPVRHQPAVQRMGLTHLAVSVGSEQTVNELTARLRSDGHTIVGNPRRTGDGYYESVVIDPDGNLIEITP